MFRITSDAAVAYEPSDPPGHRGSVHAVCACRKLHDEFPQRVFRTGRHDGHAIFFLERSGNIPGRAGPFFIYIKGPKRTFPSLVAYSDRIGLNGRTALIEIVEPQLGDIYYKLIMLAGRKYPKRRGRKILLPLGGIQASILGKSSSTEL